LRINDLQLHADHLFDSVVALVSVFRRKRSLRINARDGGVEWPFRIRVEINAGRLTGAHTTDLAFGNEGSQIDVAQVDYRHNRRSGRDDFARFGGAGRDCAVEWGDDPQIAAIGLRLLQLRAGAAGFGLGPGQRSLGRRDVRLSLTDATFGVQSGLVHAQTTLFKLGLQDGDLMSRATQTGLGLRDVRLRLIHARFELFVVERGDHLAGLDLIAFAHGDLTNAPGGLRGDRRVIALDAAAYRNDFARRV
jgi:hypothetical protein